MADEAGVVALKSGKDAWTKYAVRFARDFPDRAFDLTNADLEGVSFDSIEFGKRTQFDGSRFKDAHFSSTRFDQGASFLGCTFRGTTKFSTIRAKVDLSFDGARFEGPVEVHTLQQCMLVRFVGAHFLEGFSARGSSEANRLLLPPVSFQQAVVQGPFAFEHCIFQFADFSNARLALPLEGMRENVCFASFKSCVFQSGATFTGTEFAHGANFENARFNGSSSFRRTIFNLAPNFHDAVLHQGTQFSSKSEFPALFRDTHSAGAAEAYRTLKLAMNRQHALNEELGFFLLEMRATARRLTWWQRIPYRLYDWMSMYGQSVLRPLWVYIGVYFIFAAVYSLLSGQRWETIDTRLSSLSLYGAIPFAAALRWPEVSGASGGPLFPSERLLFVQIAIVSQSILSAVLLFLIGLGLRNMFKVR